VILLEHFNEVLKTNFAEKDQFKGEWLRLNCSLLIKRANDAIPFFHLHELNLCHCFQNEQGVGSFCWCLQCFQQDITHKQKFHQSMPWQETESLIHCEQESEQDIWSFDTKKKNKMLIMWCYKKNQVSNELNNEMIPFCLFRVSITHVFEWELSNDLVSNIAHLLALQKVSQSENTMVTSSKKAIQGTLPLTPALALNANTCCPNVFRKGHWYISHLNVRIVHANELVHRNSIQNT